MNTGSTYRMFELSYFMRKFWWRFKGIRDSAVCTFKTTFLGYSTGWFTEVAIDNKRIYCLQ